jgi:effector-binding domain-containing protein
MPDPRAPSSKIELRVLGGHQTAVMREEVNESALGEAMGRMFTAVREAIAKQGIEATSAPFARYHSFGQTIDFEAGLMVSGPIQPDGDVKPGELPVGPAAIAVHAGPYETLGATHAAMRRWMEANPGQSANGGPWELYLTDPSAEPDPARWLTEVIYPLEPNAEIK